MMKVDNTLIAYIKTYSIRLTLFAMFTAALITITWQFTKEPIEVQIMKNHQKALNAVLPPHYYNNFLMQSPVKLPEVAKLSLNEQNHETAFLATYDGKPVAVILPVIAPDGYSGKIKLLVGILTEGSITGIQVVSHNETPGLGDAIEPSKSDWLHQFVEQSLSRISASYWQPTKDRGSFDQITGATVTSRAVITALKKALQYFAEYKEVLTQILPVEESALS